MPAPYENFEFKCTIAMGCVRGSYVLVSKDPYGLERVVDADRLRLTPDNAFDWGVPGMYELRIRVLHYSTDIEATMEGAHRTKHFIREIAATPMPASVFAAAAAAASAPAPVYGTVSAVADKSGWISVTSGFPSCPDDLVLGKNESGWWGRVKWNYREGWRKDTGEHVPVDAWRYIET